VLAISDAEEENRHGIMTNAARAAACTMEGAGTREVDSSHG